ncbi:MAG: hypothetical protein M1825_000383 [Sarcosagium campestre]|nr:MAG: hypothetical protein M1825_000383 [Sarcosagium campestre]
MAEPKTSQGPPPTKAQHAPYAPTTAVLGGTPSVHTDVPITSIFLVLFILGAIVHMTILQVNLRRRHKFIMSGMLFGFCMARTITCVLRIAWSKHPTHIPLAIASQVFTAAGVVLIFVINLIFTQRIMRAAHPHFGWHKLANQLLHAYYISIVVTLIMLIVCTVQPFYTLNLNTHRIDRDVQLYGQTYFTIAAFLPVVLVTIGLLTPRAPHVDKFGEGRFRSKIRILLLAAALLTLGAAFRTGINYKTPRPRADPAWYHSRACFYVFNFAIEIAVVALYAILRVDLRFFVPNGARGPGAYSANKVAASLAIRSEENVFDDVSEKLRRNESPTDEEHGIITPPTPPNATATTTITAPATAGKSTEPTAAQHYEKGNAVPAVPGHSTVAEQGNSRPDLN